MSRLMLTGKWRTPRNSDEEEQVNIARGMKELAPGFGFFKGRHRGPAFHAPRPLQPAHQRGARPPQLIGVGIDEETALLVRADGQWEVLGNYYVKILTPAARRSWTTGGPWPRPPTSACMCCPRAGCSTRAGRVEFQEVNIP